MGGWVGSGGGSGERDAPKGYTPRCREDGGGKSGSGEGRMGRGGECTAAGTPTARPTTALADGSVGWRRTLSHTGERRGKGCRRAALTPGNTRNKTGRRTVSSPLPPPNATSTLYWPNAPPADGLRRRVATAGRSRGSGSGGVRHYGRVGEGRGGREGKGSAAWQPRACEGVGGQAAARAKRQCRR